ncbi:YQGE family putative transporter [Parabacteroides sp. PF5-5]|uniref:MFS transporter n=1 Tax=unclassified Parabacteroides TaxID=2649774 RepID=UPI0024756C62|nr:MULTISPECIES: MFS transporter [unclassified Parabacteroides]MDH6304860.1 YQGE family putative transporter [Parabacteroides sp. PH5-39]MDH6316054.1 YQGE family putative transporter [Parabacteroides sp. PF5-13]MDH6319711.1 YQGE family putative transporter [Parabacteroides sp. PH5-13]MDH6323442.1 YQGE family putative transporter [Parabacteroides sp. PH5-8]MDH6327050.1 YQGE family putative transporter [Parabacteroides sp. PH5-41]
MKDIKLFMGLPKNTRTLLLTSFLYAFVLPIIDIFVAAYIMRNSADVGRVVLYQLTVYTGIPITFFINGFLLNKVDPGKLYAFGMLLSGLSMLIMTSLPVLNFAGIAVAGLIMGISFGFFWANRDYLVLICTTDANRNYYYGLETFFNTFTLVVVPIAVGWFIQFSEQLAWVDNVNGAYKVIIYIVIAITIVASLLINTGDYVKPQKSRFVFFKYDRLWYKMLLVAVCKGLVQGFIVTAPAMLIMKIVGGEGALGTVQGIGSLITAVLMYVIGRNSKPEHRLLIYAISVLLFVAGSLINSIFFNVTSVLLFLLLMTVARPLFDLAYFPLQMRVIDYLKEKEKRNEYSYIFNHECGLYVGRFLGCGTFILINYCISDDAALIVTLPLVTILQALSYFVVKNILNSINKPS